MMDGIKKITYISKMTYLSISRESFSPESVRYSVVQFSLKSMDVHVFHSIHSVWNTTISNSMRLQWGQCKSSLFIIYISTEFLHSYGLKVKINVHKSFKQYTWNCMMDINYGWRKGLWNKFALKTACKDLSIAIHYRTNIYINICIFKRYSKMQNLITVNS